MSQSIETGRGLDAFESSQGLTTIKADSPKRFEMLLKAGENGVETLWLKWNPIETDENGFGLYGTYESNAWKIRDGKDSTKDSQGWIMRNERGEAYTKCAYADKREGVYRSVANSANRAASLAVDPGMTQRAAHAQEVSNLKKETETATQRADIAETAAKVLAAILTKDYASVTIETFRTVETHALLAAIPAATVKAFKDKLKSA